MRPLPLFAVALLALASLAAAQSSNNSTAATGGAAGGAAAASGPCALSASDAGGNASKAAALRDWRRDCVQNMTRLRTLSIESFNENKTRALLQHEANLSHVRAAFMDDRLAAYDDCRTQAAPFGHTPKGPHDGVFAACMKDKLKPLRENATAAHAAERKLVAASFSAAKESAKAQFDAQKNAWLAANPKP